MKTSKPNMQTLYIIWGAMIANQVIFLVLAFVLKAPPDFDRAGSPVDMMLLPFAGLSVMVGVLSFLARPFFLKKNVDNKSSRSTILSTYQTGSIISWALGESIGIYGFVLFMLSYEVKLIVPFVIVGTIVVVLNAPRRGVIEQLLAERATSAVSNEAASHERAPQARDTQQDDEPPTKGSSW